MIKPKIAIVAICKNESKHVLRWLNTISDADYICVLDTGSTDNTLELFHQWQQDNPTLANKLILASWEPPKDHPFHFDEARNKSKELVPPDADLLFYPDLDEFCQPGWRDHFDAIFDRNPQIKRISYKYATQCDDQENVLDDQWYDWCFANDPHYKWYNIVHEVCELTPLPGEDTTPEQLKAAAAHEYCDSNFILIKHLPDATKSRKFYDDLMCERWLNNKDDLQIACYYLSSFEIDGAESSTKAIETADQIIQHAIQVGAHAPICGSIQERHTVMWKLWYTKGQHLEALGRVDEAIQAHHTAISYHETSLVPYLELIRIYYQREDYTNALKIIDLADEFSRYESDWTHIQMNYVYDLPLWKTLVYYHLKDIQKAYTWAKNGYQLWIEKGWHGNEKRSTLIHNLRYMKQLYIQQSDVKKIAVYAICKDELQFVDKWMKSMLEADYVCVLDTGSTDGTWERLCAWQQLYPDQIILDQKTFTPWRFDTPRNASMDLIPDGMDMWWCTDLDEVAPQGWADAFRQQWDPQYGKMMYKYAWSHNSDGTPARVFWYDKLTSADRRWRWVHPVHEQLFCEGSDEYKVGRLDSNTIYLHHYPVQKDSRGNYLPLLEVRCKESPEDFYSHVYLSHEYLYQNKPQECYDYISSTTLPIAIQNVADEKDSEIVLGDLYMFMGRAKEALGEPDEALHYYQLGIQHAPVFRENYLYAAKIYLQKQEFSAAINIVNEGLQKSRRYYSWLELDKSWKEEPWDILTLAYWQMGIPQVALQCAEIAAHEDPNNDRLQENVRLIKSAIEK